MLMRAMVFLLFWVGDVVVLSTVATAMVFDDHDVTDDWNLNPEWCRRVLAAKGADLTITAEGVRDGNHAKALALAGFERGAGPFAEAGLRQV